MTWTKPLIVRELKRLHKSGVNLSYNALAKRKQSLLSAAAYHFGSYRNAITRAGIEYAEISRRPRWTKRAIIALIKKTKRDGEDLHWSAVVKRDDELSRAAFASLQPRLFGRWARALHAAGLDADDVSMYRTWDRNTILFELRERRRDGNALSSGIVQSEEPALHAAALRVFGGYSAALRAAGMNPAKIRMHRTWDRTAVVRAIRQLHRRGTSLSDSALRKTNPALHGAASRIFGTYKRARTAAIG